MTFLFDIGRVLLDFDFVPSLRRLLPPGAPDAEERLQRLLERKDEFEAGGVDSETYIDWALGVLGSESSPEEFRHAWQHIFTPNEPMWERVRQLAKDGHRLILFSNINSIHSPWIFDEFPELSLFHGAVMSFEAGFIKPNPAIYHYAIATYELDPVHTIYIDDLPQNIETGREFGFRCWQYDLKNHAAFEEWLAENIQR
jgi:putative hydrolase of the HAD superfamily